MNRGQENFFDHQKLEPPLHRDFVGNLADLACDLVGLAKYMPSCIAGAGGAGKNDAHRK